MRFFRKKNQPGGGPPGGSLCDREIPRPPHAPLPPIHAGRGAAGAGCFCACDAGAGSVWLHDGSNGRRGGKRVFPGNFSMRNTGAAGRASHWREIPHAQRAPAAVLDERHGESGGGFLCACDAGGASMRLHAGFTMDPTAARGARIAFFPVPDAESADVRRPPLPRTGNPPCARNAFAALAEAWEAERARGARRIKWKARGAPASADAIVRGSGCPCACGARVTHAICKRYRSHIPTQIYSYAAIATAAICLCRICYCRYCVDHIATAAILRRYSLHKYSLRKHTIHTHITHPLLCLPPSSHHILNPDPIFPPSHKENT